MTTHDSERDPINPTGGVHSKESRLRDGIAEAMGWEPHLATNGITVWHRGRFGLADADGDRPYEQAEEHPVPAFCSDAALGWALRKIREAGWEWRKSFNNERTAMWRATGPARPAGACPPRAYVEVIATDSDTLDAMNLLSRVLRHGKDKL